MIPRPSPHPRDPAPYQPLEAVLTEDDAGLVRGYTLYLRAGGEGGRVASAATVRLYRVAVVQLARWLAAVGRPSLRALSRELAWEWVARLADDHAPATVQLYTLAARKFYDWLVLEGELRADQHPFTRVRGPRRPERRNPPLSPDDVRRVFAVLEQAVARTRRHWLALRDLAVMAVLCDTGLRVAECAGLRLDDIDWRTGALTVTGKGGRPRTVPLGATAQRHLDRYLRARARLPAPVRAQPWVWLDRAGGPWSPAAIRLLHARVGRQVGVRLHPHRWRHTYLQALLDQGVDRETVRLLAGHRSLETLRIYTAATDERRAVDIARRHSVLDRFRRG